MRFRGGAIRCQVEKTLTEFRQLRDLGDALGQGTDDPFERI
jgi:hypothetical protein